MLKKTTAIILIMILTLSISSPAYAALPDESQTTPLSVEEILNDHHTKIFELENQPAASTYSRSTVTEESITQDTISELRDAGYEAYNVTASNYDTLEAELQTDFASMGLESSGSYIIVISGDELECNANSSPISTASVPSYDTDIGAGGPSFTYTYDNGVTYTMRYITVTASDNSNYRKSDSYDLYTDETMELLNNVLNTTISMVVNNATPDPVGTVLSILGVEFVNLQPKPGTELTYYGGTNWTRRWVQVHDETADEWYTRVSVEYVVQNASIFIYYYSTSLNKYTGKLSEDSTNVTYSLHYSNYEWLKEQAALAQISNNTYYEYTGHVKHYYGDKLLFTHYEYYGP